MKNKLLEIRLKLGYKKQKDFADYLGISKSHYNRLENNKEQPTLEVLFQISQKLNIKIDEIVHYENEPN